ncbi:MAG: GNAT family N-acetyltransferase [bacterium]|nr:GNAT family N-acetyltransferase [bacterium]
MKSAAHIISAISGREPGLLYYFPKEIQRAINDKRAIIIENDQELVACGFWTRHGDLAEIHTLYVCPELRNSGHARKLIVALEKSIKHAGINKAFLFTKHSAIEHIAKEYGGHNDRLFSLPTRTLAKIFVHRLNPLRWASYFKYFQSKSWSFKLIIID